MKLVVNQCYGGFGLSHAAVMAYAKRKGIELQAYVNARLPDGHVDFHRYVPYSVENPTFIIHYSTADLSGVCRIPDEAYFSTHGIERNDADLIAVVKLLGDKANGECAKLRIVEIPDGVDYEIEDYDGHESVHEKHRSW